VSKGRHCAARKGKKGAIVAVAHTILIILFHMLKINNRIATLGRTFSTAEMPSNSSVR
jgi:hypothetical protein